MIALYEQQLLLYVVNNVFMLFIWHYGYYYK